MIDEFNNIEMKVGNQTIARRGDIGWYASMSNNCLTEVNFSTRKARALCYLGYDNVSGFSNYQGTIEYNGKLYLFPLSKNDILVFDLNKNCIVDNILLKEYDSGMRMSAAWCPYISCAEVIDNTIYFFGYKYPTIVAVDTIDNSVFYFDAWADEINSAIPQETNIGYFVSNSIRIKNNIYSPFTCCSAILKINIENKSSEIIWIDSELSGFGGATVFNDDCMVLVGRGTNCNKIVIWNYNKNVVDKVWDYSDTQGNTEPIQPLVKCDDKFYSFPRHGKGNNDVAIYEITVNGMDYSKNKVFEFEKVDYNVRLPLTFVSNCITVLDDSTICFQTGYDYMWHEFNIKTRKSENYQIEYDSGIELIEKDAALKQAKIGNFYYEKDFPLEHYLKYIINN